VKEIPSIADNQYRSQQERQWATMIQLTRLNQKPITFNSDLIKFVENAPDTVITLISGEKFIVLESVDTIVGRVVEFRRRLLDGLVFNGLSSTTQQVLPRQERRHRLDGPEQED
jgi:flagellar protein FlbD